MPSSMAPFSPTKSMIASAPRPSVISLTVSTWLPSTLTVWCAPISPASASAGSDGSMTMISAGVMARRHWMPIWPRPPAPITTALVPGPRTGIAFLTAWIAVSPASASAAIALGSRDGSSLTTERALVNRKSANPPSRLMPGKEPLRQCMSSPARQGGQGPQEIYGFTITVSPTSTLVTAGPIACTQPAFSCPGV